MGLSSFAHLELQIQWFWMIGGVTEALYGLTVAGLVPVKRPATITVVKRGTKLQH